MSFDTDEDEISESEKRDSDSESSDAESEMNGTVFTVTLMMTNREMGKDYNPDDFIPSRETRKNEKKEVEVQIKSEIKNNDGRVIKNEPTNQN